jgi:Golgi apparatus protein 1
MNRAVLIAAALVLAPLTLFGREQADRKGSDAATGMKVVERNGSAGREDGVSKASFRDRVAEAVEMVEDACAADIADFCGKVSAGQGRIAFCMLAHEDQLSDRCGGALSRVASNLQRNVDRVAQQCLGELQAACGETGAIGRCVEQKKGSLSPPCQSIVTALGQRVLAPLVGMSVFSSDNKNLGQIVEIARGPGDKIQSIQVDIGRLLGLGTKVVVIPADKMEQLPRVRVLLSDVEVRSLPEAKSKQ